MSNFTQRSEALSSVEVLARFQAAIVGGSSVILGSVGLPVRNAATQDAITLLGRAGGTSSFQCKLTPAVLSATQTVTFPDASFTVAGLQVAQTFTANQTFTGYQSIDAPATSGLGFILKEAGANRQYLQWLGSATGLGARSGRGEFDLNNYSFAFTHGGSSDVLLFSGSGAGAVATFTLAVPSTSTTTGAVVIPNGGLGVGGAINAGGAIRALGQGAFGSGSLTGVTSAITCFRAGTDVNGDVFCAWNRSTLAADEKAWMILQNASSLYFHCINDAYNAANPWLTVSRSGYVATAAAFAVPITNSSSIRSTSPTAGIGYGTGAGGTVTQLTSKSTGVTLNTVSGTITMNGAALASATNVAFVFTNSAIAATDKVEVDHDSAGTLCAYNICVTPAAGSATVTVRNMTAGSLSEAIVLRFFVKKAVIS